MLFWVKVDRHVASPSESGKGKQVFKVGSPPTTGGNICLSPAVSVGWGKTLARGMTGSLAGGTLQRKPTPRIESS